jgi:hypothetical protein
MSSLLFAFFCDTLRPSAQQFRFGVYKSVPPVHKDRSTPIRVVCTSDWTLESAQWHKSSPNTRARSSWTPCELQDNGRLVALVARDTAKRVCATTWIISHHHSHHPSPQSSALLPSDSSCGTSSYYDRRSSYIPFARTGDHDRCSPSSSFCVGVCTRTCTKILPSVPAFELSTWSLTSRGTYGR